ncbi:MAG: AraC family transcriptional regulator [Cyanobacteria bacterium J06621_15]
MQLNLPRQNYSKFLEQLKLEYGFVCEVTNIETYIKFPSHLANGSINIAQLRPGLGIQINSINPLENFAIKANFLESDPFEFNFYLNGYARGTVSNSHKNFSLDLKATQNLILFGGADSIGVWECAAKQHTHVVEIYIEPQFIYQLIEDNANYLPADLLNIIEGKKEKSFYETDILTPQMQMALHQLINCSYQGVMKQMYLESKALELIVLKLAQLKDKAKPTKNTKTLKSDDVERIYYAREILIKNIENPPSLLNLAKIVGINDYKLKLGFRQVFNTTVFGYLRTHRMEQARQLLINQNIRVSEAARIVGYSSLSRFNTAFKNQFGVSPSACLKRKLK